MILVVCIHIKIDRPVAHISIARLQNLLNNSNLLYYVTACAGLYAWRISIKHPHCIVEEDCISLRNLHRLQLLQARLLLYLVISLICIVLQMPNICNVANIPHFITQVPEEPCKHIKCNSRTCVTKVRISIYCRSANIQAYPTLNNGFEELFSAGKRVINQIISHSLKQFNLQI